MWWFKKPIVIIDIAADVDLSDIAILEDEGYLVLRVVGDPNKVVAVLKV
jgi:hypothetical protein